MELICINSFGNFTPGDLVLVPEGANFDTAYFALHCRADDDAAEDDQGSDK